uniref:G_PROTEIN_RECEP_F1_2 domain-containing protein n=1 Tax=Meloidogyne hapla TaxID=6305 RepID=A0A1I8AZA6_MELHA
MDLLLQLNCTLLENLFDKENNSSKVLSHSATFLSKGSANAVSDMALTVGNIVLLSSGMKNQANILLAAMACVSLERFIGVWRPMHTLKNVSSLLLKYLRIAKYAQSLIAVIMPVIAVAILNVSLVYFLRKRRILNNNNNTNNKGEGENEFKEQEFR